MRARAGLIDARISWEPREDGRHCFYSDKGGNCSMHELLNVTPDVANALRDQRPVVALESTVIAHGLPRPQNLQTANRLQDSSA